MRFLGVLLFLAVIGAASFVYDVKYRTTRLARETANLENSIHDEENAIAALRAEWSALNQPPRLQALSRRHLPEFQNLGVTQMAFAYELPDRAADLAKFINNLDEQKGLETPIDKKTLKVKAPPQSAFQANAPMKLIPIPLR
jgi:hypothetical protein